LKIEISKKRKVPLPVSDEGNQTNKGLKLKGALESSFNIQARDTLDCEIARVFYSSGLPFHLARSPYYRNAFSYAANTSILVDMYRQPIINWEVLYFQKREVT